MMRGCLSPIYHLQEKWKTTLLKLINYGQKNSIQDSQINQAYQNLTLNFKELENKLQAHKSKGEKVGQKMVETLKNSCGINIRNTPDLTSFDSKKKSNSEEDLKKFLSMNNLGNFGKRSAGDFKSSRKIRKNPEHHQHRVRNQRGINPQFNPNLRREVLESNLKPLPMGRLEL